MLTSRTEIKNHVFEIFSILSNTLCCALKLGGMEINSISQNAWTYAYNSTLPSQLIPVYPVEQIQVYAFAGLPEDLHVPPFLQGFGLQALS